MSTNDYVKYLTQQLVKYMDTPKAERIQQKQKKKQTEAPPYSNRWLGILPFALKLFMEKRRKK
ncbi:YqzE family protein [Metabacillus herbersteinensis]|uniref:YqzE family protein n=1 Tax=Metabacillus herbersteinensis TaxID=283816 RepID=A0ABV6G9B0_9BACI